MPDGLISYNLAPPDPRKARNRSRPEPRLEANGGGRVLEPLVEHSSLEADDLSSNYSGVFSKISTAGHITRSMNLNMTTSSSEDEFGVFHQQTWIPFEQQAENTSESFFYWSHVF